MNQTPDRLLSIAVVDDSLVNLAVIGRELREAGFLVETSRDPVQTLDDLCEREAARRPDVILVDIHMPVMNGLEFVRALRAALGSGSPAAIILSGDRSEEAVRGAFEAGAVDYLPRPHSVSELRVKVQRAAGMFGAPGPGPLPERRRSTPPRDTIGPWTIVRELGRGGMGSVYLVEKPEQPGERFALKVLLAARDDVESRLRFRREIDILTGLEHPGLAGLQGTGRDGPHVYYVMDYIRGERLDHLRERSGPLSPGQVAWILLGLLDAAGYMHERGLIHRDIKPSNIVCRPSGDPVLLDLGLARSLVDSQLTATADVVGTPAYMSPEQISGRELDHRTDLYSIGLIGLELLMGRRLIDEPQPYAAFQKILNEPLPRAADLPGPSPRFAAILDSLAARDRSARPASAKAAAAAIRALTGAAETLATG